MKKKKKVLYKYLNYYEDIIKQDIYIKIIYKR